ncbi:transmembrane protein, putative (macronuclear) [Tetrahymena thermophila SB210]|uniref:Transmembrane protein, putative n=1 Tax=Tetrahymena thermophila (strain SB210) TaxID=312017 RepID=Q23ZB5_TETTS|nr:transmembrane protein, putative [Tetrahymena thermophila SB210]EAS01856.2 transmembrane protein, putative [Tetrahymena thermophila SB210]|eukprot:XP_001022101.2 transmembrane protein, putative [Tetrahymena thermophila SB210]
MIIVKNQQENNNYLGNISIDNDTELHLFQSNNDIYWHINLFNKPFSVFNLAQTQKIQDTALEINLIAIYDNKTNEIIIYDVTKSIQENIYIEMNFKFDFQITMIDWSLQIFLWINNNTIYTFNKTQSSQIQKISTLDSQIIDQKVCVKQQVIIVKTASLNIYSISIKTQTTQQIDVISQQPYSDLQYYLQCDENLVIIYYPQIQIFNFVTGINIMTFNNVDSFDQFQNSLQCVPLVNLSQQLIVYLYDQANSLFKLGDYTNFSYLFEYRFNNTNLFYDFKFSQLLATTGSAKVINSINIPGQCELQTYKTNRKFYKDAIYFYEKGQKLIVVDLTPMIYILDYSQNNFDQCNTDIQNVKGILMDTIQNVIFLYSDMFISTYSYPDILFIETFSINYQNGVEIQNVYLNTFQQTLIVQTTQQIVAFDLQEVLYSGQTNLLQYQNVQNIVLNGDYLVSYSIINLSINLFNDAQLNFQLNYLELSIESPMEINLVNFDQGDITQAFIYNNFVVLPSANMIQIFNLQTNQLSQINLLSNNLIKFTFKLQKKYSQGSKINWWKISVDFEERINNNDANDANLICIVSQQETDYQIQIADIQELTIKHTQILKYIKVTNIVNDPIRKLIYVVINRGITQVYNFQLKLLITIKNSCLKQAILNYDTNFIYSICPNSIIIYNGLSFQQQFPVINQGIKDAINQNGNNVISQVINQPFSFLQNFKLVINSNYAQLQVLISSYNNIQHFILPLSVYENCSVQLQYQKKPLENIKNIIKLNQIVPALSDIQVLSLIETEYQNDQFIYSIYQFELDEISVISQQLFSLVIQSRSQINKIYCTFKNNWNVFGQGGSIYAIENINIQILHTVFQENFCQMQNGGAIFIQNKITICQLSIMSSQFIQNKAYASTGGAISLINSNLIMEDSLIKQNQAAIGGGIYYEQIVPDLILDLEKKIHSKNSIIGNQAQLYGHNFGSTLRKIELNLDDIKVPSYSIKKSHQQQIQIQQFKSGNQIFFDKIQLLDEENNPIQYPELQLLQFDHYSSNVQSIIQQIGIQIICEQQLQQIQCSGELQSKQIISDGFKLNVQIMYKPLTEMALQLQSNQFSQLIDSKGNTYIRQQPLSKSLTIQIESCSVGEIQKQIGDSIICDECPEGKYSLNQNDLSCQQCPDTAIKCYSSTINLKNGYWRLNNQTDNIIQCIFNRDSCQPESPESKFNCIKGNIGPLCYSCDIYGDVWGENYSQIFNPGVCYKCEENFLLIFLYNFIIFLLVACYTFFILKNILYKLQAKLASYYLNKAGIIFFGSTIYKADKPQIVSKILTDHLQIISLLASFQFNQSNYYKLPFQVSGSAINITSKSIDCYFSNHPEMQPLWLFQISWSFMLPLSLLAIYLIVYLLSYFIIKKKNIIVNYIKTASIFFYLYFFPMVVTLLSRSMNCINIGNEKYLDLDFNVRCFDSKKHQPYVLFFSIPLLIIWAIFIPLFLFLKVRKGKRQKWSIFQEIKYSFIFAGYKEKFYYWEFGKLVYKSLLIIISVLLQQIEFFKICLLNVVFLIQSYIIFKSRPYIIRNFNSLLLKSSLLCSISLNVSSIQSNFVNENQVFYHVFLTLFLLAINIQFIVQLIMGIIQITISNEKINRNFIQELIYILKVKYPRLFENIQIQSNHRIRSLIKVKSVKNKIRNLLLYFKNHSFYHQESFQTHFNQQINQTQTQQSNLQQSNKFVLIKSHELNQSNKSLKQRNQFQNMRDMWAYYTRQTKQSPLLFESNEDKTQLDTQQSKQSENDNERIMTSNSCTNADKVLVELVNNSQ